MPALRSLLVGDTPATWESLGFAVDAGVCWIDGVGHDLAGEGRGIHSWSLSGLRPSEDGALDGLTTHIVDAGVALARAEPHPNGVVCIDHLVVATPDVDRTVSRFEASGLELRRTRQSEAYGGRMRQAFFKLGPVVLEVVGPPERMDDRPAGFFGLAFTVADLDATAAYLGDRLHPAKDAVQPGRRIATLDRGAGATVAMAFMSPGPVEY